MKTHFVIVHFDNGDTIKTSINGTIEEISQYYAIGREFNLGDSNGGDLMAKVIKLEISE